MTAPVQVPDEWRGLHPAAKAHVHARLAEAVWRKKRDLWSPYPWQVPPDDPVTQGAWLMLGGRGTGKTDGAARYVVDHVHGPPCDPRLPGGHRIAIVAPTLGDAVESCVQGPSGLKAHDPGVRLRGGTGGTYARWASGAEAKLFGASTPDDVERLRAGGNRCLVWMEEVAAMRYLGPALDHTALGLRLGVRPHYVMSTTPKPRPEVRALLKDPRVVVSRGRTEEAVHLDESVRLAYLRRYGGTRLGRQELDGEVLADVEGALWNLSGIEAGRVAAVDRGDLARIVVAIDPAATSAETSDETGLVVVGVSSRGSCPACGVLQSGMGPHLFVLQDLSGRFTPDGWARRAVDAYEVWEADAIVAETNNGGEMVGSVLRTVSRSARYRAVTATRGKRTRAEPVAALYEQGKAHHVGGSLARLEDQMTTWVPGEGDSPDRMDALVWGATEATLTRRGHASTGR